MLDLSVSVVIPAYNRAHLLSRALDSVFAQSYQPDEVIVVDDGSTDDTKVLIQENYPQTHYLYQENKGVSAARNYGIHTAQGNWIALLDSDDSWQTDKLARQVQAIKHETTYRFCHTNETWYRNGKTLTQKKKHVKKGGHIFQHCLPLCAISPSSVLLDKSLFHELGFFDEALPACEDYDMWLRICSLYPVLFIDEPLTNKFGGHQDQLSQQHWGMDRFRIIALQKSIESGSLNNADREAAINMLLNKIEIFLKGAEKHGNQTYHAQFITLLEHYA